jgi:phage tail-like protein
MRPPFRPMRAFPAGIFELMIDHHFVKNAYIKSVEGGHIKMNTVDEGTGGSPHQIKHITTLEAEPITIEVGMSQGNPLLTWIAKTWRKEYSRQNGSITHGNSKFKAEFIHEFEDALIEEVTIPTLDAASKDALWLKLKLRAERVRTKYGDGTDIGGNFSHKQKLWQSSCFRLRLDGVDTEHTDKIEAFTIKVGLKPVATGPQRLPEYEPVNVKFPDLKCTMSLKYAESMHKWYKQVVTGIRDPRGERDGAIEFLTPDRKQVVGSIQLFDVGIKGFNIPKTEARADQVKKCTFDLFVGRMELGTPVHTFLEMFNVRL